MKFLIPLIILATLWSCSKPTDTTTSQDESGSLSLQSAITAETADTTELDYDNLYKLESYSTVNRTTDGKWDSVDYDCVILINPTPEQIEEMKKDEGEEAFFIGADDSNWYQFQAMERIDSVGIKTITAAGDFIRLKGKEKAWNLNIRKRNLPAWNLIFFNANKEPQVVSAIDVTVEQVKDYFEVE